MPLYHWTGNPWVDSGISAILEWNGKRNPEKISGDDLGKIKDAIIKIYLADAWKKGLFSVFPNSPVTNPSIKDKEGHLKRFYDGLLKNIGLLADSGDCIACGRRSVNSQRNRTHIPLTGYENSHFFSHTTGGADYCDACTFAVQCAPLLFYSCGKLILVHSNSDTVMRVWAKERLKEIREQMASRSLSGFVRDRYKNPVNALFRIAVEIVTHHDNRLMNENACIRIHHFTNYNQGPELDIYDLPAPVFRFLASIQYKSGDWQRLVRRGFGKVEGKGEDKYCNYRNSVYESLLKGTSIIWYFLEYGSRTVIGDWGFLKCYLKEVLGMDDVRIEKIRKLGDEISELIRNSDKGKTRLGQIERASSYISFCNILYKLVKDRVSLKEEKPLFTFDDFIKYLFPDGAFGWKEVYYMLLFRLYEKLHPWLVTEGLVTTDDEEGSEEAAS